MKTLFLDSSVLFSAVCSPTGGSSKIFSLKSYKLTVSTFVLTEVERNVRQKLFGYHLNRFLKLANELNIVNPKISKKELEQCRNVIIEKDATILAQAKILKVDYLVTLDKRDFLNDKVNDLLYPAQVVTPKTFFEAEGLL